MHLIQSLEKSPICLRPTLRYKREKLFLKQFLQKQKHSLKRRCPGVWDRLEKVSSVSAAILAIDDLASQSCTSQASRSLSPATKGELRFSEEQSMAQPDHSRSPHSHITLESQPLHSHRNLREIAGPLASGPGRRIAALQPNRSRTAATSQPHCTRNKAEPQPHHSRITTESQPHDRHTRAESPYFEL